MYSSFSVFELPAKSPERHAERRALADNRGPKNFFGEYSTKLPQMRRAFWGQAVRNIYIFQGFEIAYLARAQMPKRQIPRTAAGTKV